MDKLIVLGISSDIAVYLARRFLARGAEVRGTFRSRGGELDALERDGAILSEVDVLSPESVGRFAAQFAASGAQWDTLISAVGVLTPIGPFFSLDFEAWAASVEANSVAQLRALHALYPMRDKSRPCKVILFAGGGVNSPFDFYSAYCVGKLNLIKMCELLHSEYADIHISIIGTGWVNTKIHAQTVAAGGAAGANLDRTRAFLGKAEQLGTPMSDVADCVDWCLTAPRAAVSGRNFAVVHDPWRDAAFIDRLIADPDLCKLRRRQPDSIRATP
jgi:NAD(P)-dependent dehydrogenase (short-subunit alcohol dehydrogenase family)